MIEEQVAGTVAEFMTRAGKDKITTSVLNKVEQFYINHGLNALDQKYEHALKIFTEKSPEELERTRDSAKARLIQSVYEHTIALVEKQFVEDAAEFFSETNTLTQSAFNKAVQDYITSGSYELDQRFEHALQNIFPGQSPEEFESARDSAKDRLIQSINEVCRSAGWVLPRREESNVEWESPTGPFLIKRGLFLQQLELDKDNEARGFYGSVSIFKNGNGDKLIGKISYDNMRDEQGNIVDDLAKEWKGYQTIYDAVGPHPNLVNAYGIAQVLNNGERKCTLLMDAVPGPTGEIAFDALRKSWKDGKISSAEYWGVIQFISRRLLNVIEHMSKAGVVHNDIKPENFLVNEKTGEPVLIDLGFWSRKDEKHNLGTRGFAPPEAIEKGRDERSDVFTVGASLVSGIENPNKLPSKGLFKGESFKKDREGNMRRIRGNYSADTAYTSFINSVMMKDRDNRVNAEEAKNLDFLKDSMLDEDTAKEVIKKALFLDRTEEQRPRKEQWKQIAPQVVLSDERRQGLLTAFKGKPDLAGYAKLRNVSKTDPALEDFLKNDVGDLLDPVEQDVARHAEEFLTKSSWFDDVKKISETVPQTAIKSGVDIHGVRLKNADKEADSDYELSVKAAEERLSSIEGFKVEYLRRYADEAEAFLRDVGTLRGGIYDDNIAEQVQRVRERAAVARRMVEIVEADLSSLRKPGNGGIRAHALEIERQLKRRR